MKSHFSKIILCAASLCMLTSCAKEITSKEAMAIADSWKEESNYDAAEAKFTKVVGVTKKSNGEKSEDTKNISRDDIKSMIGMAHFYVYDAAIVTYAKFKADGKAIEVSYKTDSDEFEMKTNAYGLITFMKEVDARNGSWTEITCKWSR